MDFLRLHLPGLHQALRGVLDSLSSFVSYLMGDEVPTADRKEERAAEELGEVAAGRQGKPEKKEAQEALEGLGGSQSQEDGGLRGPREAGRCQEGSSATEQTWAWEEGSSHRSQAERQDTGVQEAAKAARCQEPRAHLEARKESEAGSEAGRDNSSEAQESQGPSEQEVKREETLRTREQEEEAEEVRERKPEVARKAESEWTWHREPEGVVGANGQKVAGDSRESLKPVKEAIAEEIHGSAAKQARQEEELMVVLRGSEGPRAQEAQESGTECEDRTTSVREEDWTASGREEDGKTSSREEDGTASGREEDGTASGREEDGTTSGREEDWTASGREEDGTTSGREEDWTASCREEDWTASGREEDGTASSREEDGPASDSGEDRTASGREEDSTVLEREENWTTSGREEDGTASGREEDSTALEREEARTTTGREEDGTASGREEDSTALGREEARTTTGRAENGTASGREEENRTASGSEEAGITLGRVEARTTSVGKEGDLSEARTTEYGEVSGEKTSEGTGKTWAFEEASRGEQEEEVDENREAEMSFPPKQTRVLGTESAEEPAKEQRAGAEAEEGRGSEGEVREGFEVQEDQGGKEAEGKQTSAIRTVPAHLEEEVAAEKAKEEEEGCRVSEAELPKDNLANEPEEDADLEVAPEASSPEKESSQERSDGEAQTGGEAQGCSGAGWGDLEHEVTEGREPEPVAGSQTLVEQPEEELWGASALSREETGGSPEEYPRNMGGLVGAEAWENQRRDVERGDTGEEKADAEEGEVAGGQAPEESEGGRESTFPDVPEAGGEWKKAQEIGAEEGETLGAESQELGGRHGADAGTGQSLGESDGGETKDEEVEAVVPWGADPTPSGDGRLEEATLSLQDSEDPGASSLAAEIARDDVALDRRAAGVEGGPAREAGEAWGSEGRQEVRGGVELMEVTWGENRGWLGFGSEGSADEEAAGRGAQAEALEAREGEPRGEWVEVREPAVEEGSCGMDGFTSGSQVVRAEGTVATREAEGLPGGQTLLKEEAVGWQMKEEGQDSEGGCGDHRPEEEAGRPLDVEDAEETEDRRAEAEDIVPEGLEDVQGPEDQSTSQEPAEAELGPHRETGETAGSAGGGACGLWSEALLPGALLDVSAPRSRVLLSRNSSLRRSRPSSRRTRAPEPQEVPPSPPPEEQLSAPERRLLQAEERPEPRPPKPEGTPLPARRRPLGRGFGLAHMGMMQELQARLGQPKPQRGAPEPPGSLALSEGQKDC
ncbi:apolipoprotein B receptor isoform X8 [Lutra lutra]|uniref:apolipoprotein B receptor isoform X8 n=1 Tax=Lutra lutra TaxID=9657 RepID=UPI001FD4865E|nr:apolipoprotein B receptor isoform X8 [Lutra lutra]